MTVHITSRLIMYMTLDINWDTQEIELLKLANFLILLLEYITKSTEFVAFDCIMISHVIQVY